MPKIYTNKKQLLFVFRKQYKGNYSIEKIYNNILQNLKATHPNEYLYQSVRLNHHYDMVTFLKCFFTSLFSHNKIIQITGACNYMILAFPFNKRVLTIHDLYHFHKFKGIKGILYDLFYFKFPAFFSHKIIAVSENTKNKIIEQLHIDEHKIEVINNPLLIGKEFSENKVLKTFNKEVPIKVLQIGAKPLKNFKRLLEATKDLNVNYSFVHSDTTLIKKLITRFNIEKRAKVYSNLTEEALYSLYKDNDLLFFASEDEGFGLPILEAQYFGLAVITSDIPPMNIVGKGSILVDPYSIESISKGFKMLYDTSVMKDNFRVSNNNYKSYSLPKVLELYLELYKKM